MGSIFGRQQFRLRRIGLAASSRFNTVSWMRKSLQVIQASILGVVIGKRFVIGFNRIIGCIRIIPVAMREMQTTWDLLRPVSMYIVIRKWPCLASNVQRSEIICGWSAALHVKEKKIHIVYRLFVCENAQEDEDSADMQPVKLCIISRCRYRGRA